METVAMYCCLGLVFLVLVALCATTSKIQELKREVQNEKKDRDYWRKLFDNVTKEARTKKPQRS